MQTVEYYIELGIRQTVVNISYLSYQSPLEYRHYRHVWLTTHTPLYIVYRRNKHIDFSSQMEILYTRG